MKPIISIGKDAIPHLLEYCQRELITQVALVADQYTYAALGKRVADACEKHGLDVRRIIFTHDPVIADEYHIVQVLIQSDSTNRAYIAVGSGTLTDIVRFVCLARNAKFISVPTAPSVDAFTSVGAALTIGRSKQTIPAIAPNAIFADLETLCAAPRPMIAAGFADVLGKFTSLADWKLGHLLWGERYDEAIASRASVALQSCLKYTNDIARTSEEGVRCLTDALMESGQCIADFGSSESASGSEHHLSHYWEMKSLWENRPALLHGAKVGVASILIAQRYEKIRQLSRADMMARLNSIVSPTREQMIEQIRAGYGSSADAIIANHKAFLDLDDENLGRLKKQIVDSWDQVRAIAATVPSPDTLTNYLRQVDAPTTPQELGLCESDVAAALAYADYLRNRYTILKLVRLLGIEK